MALIITTYQPSDKQRVMSFLGITEMSVESEDVILAQWDVHGDILGMLSYSRIYSTWQEKSMAINSIRSESAFVRKQMLIHLAKKCVEEGCRRIDTYTNDPILTDLLLKMNAIDLTEVEDWNAFFLKNVKEFVAAK